MLCGVAALIAAAPARDAAGPSPAPVAAALATSDISLAQAMAAVEVAQKKAAAIGTKMDIAIVDAGGNLKAFARMDGAWLGSIDISIKKAKTARYFDMDTGAIGKLSQPGGPLFGIEHSNGGLITFPGGVPIKAADGTVIGAIGVSGSTVENDHAVALAGAAAPGPAAGGTDMTK
ncbi:MAG: GlcG/HbpS family heme-binding protein [Phycisphaerales bacterium]